MKSRRVIVTLEVKTDAPLRLLRDVEDYTLYDWRGGEGKSYVCELIQCQVNVVKKEAA